MTLEENLKFLETQAILDNKILDYTGDCYFHRGLGVIEHGELLPLLLVSESSTIILVVRPCDKHFDAYIKNGTSWGPWKVL